MILINTTFALDEKIETPFKKWVTGQFKKEAELHVGATGFLLTRVLGHGADDELDEAAGDEALTYAMQFMVADADAAKRWMDHYSLNILRDCAEQWGSSLLQFTTLLEVVEN